jgi:transcriptional regulator with XRE-family HTH domain
MKMAQLKTRNYSAFGKKIVKHLIDKDMTARQLADALGTTPQYLNKIIHGERSGKKYIEAIKSILDIAA